MHSKSLSLSLDKIKQSVNQKSNNFMEGVPSRFNRLLYIINLLSRECTKVCSIGGQR